MGPIAASPTPGFCPQIISTSQSPARFLDGLLHFFLQGRDPEVDPLEHFLIVDVYSEVGDLKHKNLDSNEKAPKEDFGGHRQTELS